ncbi:MAG: SRPBCC family protein [Verrucomicrobiota bacterium]
MKTTLLVLAAIVLVLVFAVAVIYLVGRAQPERHTASISFRLPRPRATVWTALTDYAAMPRWWPAVKSIRFETRPDGEIITWSADARGREIGFRTREQQAPARLVREITGDDLPFGGTWTYELRDEPGGTRLTLTEDGFVKPPFFRGVMKLFMKPEGTMRDFEKHFVPYIAGR